MTDMEKYTVWTDMAGRDWKELVKIILEGLKDDTLGDLLDHRLKEIASELALLEVLMGSHFDEVEMMEFFDDVGSGKPMDRWADRLVKAVRRGPIQKQESKKEER